MPVTVETFSYDSDKDQDIGKILKSLERGEKSAHIRMVLRFYEGHHKNDVTEPVSNPPLPSQQAMPVQEILSRLKAIEEKLSRGIPAILPDELSDDDLNFLGVMSQIDSGEFDKQ